MVKVGGKRNTHKACKKQVNFSKTGRKFVKVGGNNNFRETEGINVLKQENRGEILNFLSIAKKRSSEIFGADEN